MPHIVSRILLGDPPIAYPHCYGSRWKRPLSHTATPAHVLVTYRATFTALREGEFIWFPYDALMESLPNDCTNHSELWAYCGWMVYWNVAEPHVLNRVSRQFGYVQGEPEPLYVVSVREHMDNHKGKLTGEHGTNWLEKKGAEVDCWKYRHSHIYQLPGPAGGGVTPGYMQWFYECTALLITSPTAQNAPNVYPEWGGVQQTQNEALRQIHDLHKVQSTPEWVIAKCGRSLFKSPVKLWNTGITWTGWVTGPSNIRFPHLHIIHVHQVHKGAVAGTLGLNPSTVDSLRLVAAATSTGSSSSPVAVVTGTGSSSNIRMRLEEVMPRIKRT